MTVQITISDLSALTEEEARRCANAVLILAGVGSYRLAEERQPHIETVAGIDRSEASDVAQWQHAATEPSAPPVPAAPPSVDSRGLPWDARIHASTKAVNADGTWRNRRGAAPEVVAEVEAELKATMEAPAPADAQPVPPPPPAASSPATQATGPLPPPPPSGAITFPQLVRAATARVAQGLLTQPAIVQACQAAGLPDLPALALRPDLVATVATALGIEVSP